MRVWRGLDAIEPSVVAARPVVTIGNFDGVHRGHQEVLRAAVQDAVQAVAGTTADTADTSDRTAAGPAPVVAIVFDPHPMAVIRPEAAPQPLTTIDRRAELLGAYGVDAVLVLTFDEEFASWTPQEFTDRVLVGALHARAVVVGRNFTYGHRAAGNVDSLAAAGRSDDPGRAFTVGVVDLAGTGDGPVWSSTTVRTLLADGDVETAAEVLGRPVRVVGTVVRGDQRGGSQLGYPTANVPAGPAVAGVPADGVYAGRLTVLDEPVGTPTVPRGPQPAAISVGTNPTFDGRDRRVEAYVLDRDDLELYDRRVAVDLVTRLRGQETFDSVEALITQMDADVAAARNLLAELDSEPDSARTATG